MQQASISACNTSGSVKHTPLAVVVAQVVGVGAAGDDLRNAGTEQADDCDDEGRYAEHPAVTRSWTVHCIRSVHALT